MKYQNIAFSMRLIGLMLAAFVLNINVALAQKGKVVFNATASKKEVVAGGSIEVSFKMIGVVGGNLQPPKFSPFTLNGGISESSGMQFINGDAQGHHTWTFSLAAPPTPGVYTIPAAHVVHKGTTYASNPLTIKVVPAGKAQSGGVSRVPAGADNRVFLATELSASNVYVGQQVVVTLNLYTTVPIRGKDILRIPKPSSGTVKELEKYDSNVRNETVQGRAYLKEVLFASSFFADKPGKITISPGAINVGLRTRNLLMPTEVLSLASEPIELDVKALPQPAPEGFTGLVGSYQVEWLRARDSVGVGDASVVELEMRGNGDAKALLAPKINIPAGVEGFEPVVKAADEFENGQERIHTQNWEYTFSTKQEGYFECLPLLAWFDPDSNKYITWTQPYVLMVGPARLSGGAAATDDAETTPFWTTPKGQGSVAFLGAALLLGIYLLLARKKKEPVVEQRDTAVHPLDQWELVPPPATPIPSALEEAPPPVVPVVTDVPQSTAWQGNSVLANLDKYVHDEAQTKAFYQTVLEALKTHFSKQFNLPLALTDRYTVLERLQERHTPPEQLAHLSWLWRTCEEALFAGQQHHERKTQALQIAQQWLN